MRFCLSPALVSLIFRFTWLMDWFVFVCVLVCALLGLAVAERILPISRGSFRIHGMAPIIFSPLGHPCVALGPHRSVFTCPVRTWSHPSHLSHLQQRVLCGCGVSGFLFCLVLCGFCVCVWLFCFCLFACFWFLFVVSCFPLLLCTP